MNYYLFLAGAFGVGCGIAIAAALLTYRDSSPPAAEATDAQRQYALDRFKIWNEFWKYFLVSFALVLITTLLGQILKERELDLQKSKQDSDLTLQKSKQDADMALEQEKQKSTSLMAENTNLGSFLDKAMVNSADQQFRFASYFSHLVRDSEARQRWKDYAKFIQETKQATQQLAEEANRVTAKLNDKQLPQEQRTELERQRNEVESKLDLNMAVLQAPSSASWAVYGEQNKASKNWSERHFDMQGGSKTSVPKPNDTVTAINNVFIRNAAPVWDDATQDLKVGTISGSIKPGDRVLVLEVLDSNSPNDENAYYFIRLLRLPRG